MCVYVRLYKEYIQNIYIYVNINIYQEFCKRNKAAKRRGKLMIDIKQTRYHQFEVIPRFSIRKAKKKHKKKAAANKRKYYQSSVVVFSLNFYTISTNSPETRRNCNKIGK